MMAQERELKYYHYFTIMAVCQVGYGRADKKEAMGKNLKNSQHMCDLFNKLSQF